MKSIAILLTVHNRKMKTLQCLAGLYQQILETDNQLDVYLTNDGCTDGTSDVVSRRFPEVNIITGSGNLYWNRGMHTAWKEAVRVKEYDYYLWLNDDTVLEDRALLTLLDTSVKVDNKSIVVGTTKSQKDGSITYGGRSSYGKLINPSESYQPCSFFNGNIVFIPNTVYKIVGMNDPFFHHSLGDFDYGLRASKLGVKSYVAPGILGTCDVHEVLPTWCNPKKSLKQRWKVFRSPLGQNPEEFFVFEKRHNGLMKAIFHYATNHLRMLCPWIWNIK